MSLKSLLEKQELVTCSPETKVPDVAKIMRDKNIGALLVTESDNMLGIVTDRDIVLRGLANGEAVESVEVEKIMSAPVESVSEKESVFEVIEQMGEKGIRRVAVLDESHKPIGMVSSGDVLELWGKEMGNLSRASASNREKLVKH